MSNDELANIQQQKKELKKKKSDGYFEGNNDDYYLKLMDLEDDEILVRINMFDAEFQEAYAFKKSITEDLMSTVGHMQRFNTELAKARYNKHKAKRYRDKVYNEKYEFYRLGRGNIQLKSKTEYDCWIGKDGRYSRTASYCETYDILIQFLEEAVKQLSQKIFVLQSLIKAKEYETGPNY